MAVLAVALLLLAAVAALVGRGGVEPGWVAAGRHSLSEAGYRVAGGWEDFSDWLRSGGGHRRSPRSPRSPPRDPGVSD
jgi:hypothetical protein